MKGGLNKLSHRKLVVVVVLAPFATDVLRQAATKGAGATIIVEEARERGNANYE